MSGTDWWREVVAYRIGHPESLDATGGTADTLFIFL